MPKRVYCYNCFSFSLFLCYNRGSHNRRWTSNLSQDFSQGRGETAISPINPSNVSFIRPVKKKVIALLLAYNAEKTLEKFCKTIPRSLVDEIIVFDDASSDQTVDVAKRLRLRVYRNKCNLGYGGNLKRALSICLEEGADIIVDIHPDGEYGTNVLPSAISKMKDGADLVLGNRFRSTKGTLQSGMFIWKYVVIKFLNYLCAVVLKTSGIDFHTGFRVYSRRLLKTANYIDNNSGFLFSFEIIVQCIYHHLRLEHVPVETHYSGSKRGASLKFCVIYVLQTLGILAHIVLNKFGVQTNRISRLIVGYPESL